MSAQISVYQEDHDLTCFNDLSIFSNLVRHPYRYFTLFVILHDSEKHIYLDEQVA